MRFSVKWLAAFAFLSIDVAAAAPAKTLDIYFIDVEGGQSLVIGDHRIAAAFQQEAYHFGAFLPALLKQLGMFLPDLRFIRKHRNKAWRGGTGGICCRFWASRWSDATRSWASSSFHSPSASATHATHSPR